MVILGPSLTEIQTAHEGHLSIDQAEFLMVGPEQNYVVARAIQRLQGVAGGSPKVGGVERQLAQFLLDVEAARGMIGVPKDGDVGVQALEVMPSMLLRSNEYGLDAIDRIHTTDFTV